MKKCTANIIRFLAAAVGLIFLTDTCAVSAICPPPRYAIDENGVYSRTAAKASPRTWRSTSEIASASGTGSGKNKTASAAGSSGTGSGKNKTASAAGSNGTETVKNTPESNRGMNVSEAETSKAGENTARIMLTGDIMCLKMQQHAAYKNGKYDFNGSFKYVEPIFDKADFVIGNLETLTAYSKPVTKDRGYAEDGNPACNGPVAIAQALRQAGYDAFVTSNNHSCDYGKTGIVETVEVLDTFGFAHTGTAKAGDDGHKRYILADVNGIRLAILSSTHIVNQRWAIAAEGLDNMIDLYDPERIKADIAAARADGAEFVIAYCHWGTENTHEVNSLQKNSAQAVAEAGADLIIGSHPHCLQNADTIETADGRSVPVIYSMGNFVSSMGREINNDTIILDVILQKSTKGVTIADMTAIPCYTVAGTYCITPVSPEINGGKESASLAASEKRIKNVMSNLKF